MARQLAANLIEQPVAREFIDKCVYKQRKRFKHEPTSRTQIPASWYPARCSIVLKPTECLGQELISVECTENYASTIPPLQRNTSLFVDEGYLARFVSCLQLKDMQQPCNESLFRGVAEICGFWLGVAMLRVVFFAIMNHEIVLFSHYLDDDSRDWLTAGADKLLLSIFKGRLEFARVVGGFDMITQAYLVYPDSGRPGGFNDIMWNIDPDWIHTLFTQGTIGSEVVTVPYLTTLRGDPAFEVHSILPGISIIPRETSSPWTPD
ncbi:hypothetical protein F4779DRAFT_615772 [Xylariaceae sp. FL0662B]|nr:hypothetical protein F4779DRAFT_615772 [Xylariaceae sp. FL0662B]